MFLIPPRQISHVHVLLRFVTLFTLKKHFVQTTVKIYERTAI